jgi:hypothetical protein
MDVQFWARCSLSIFFIECKVVRISFSVSWMCWKNPRANALDRGNFTYCSPTFWSQWVVCSDRQDKFKARNMCIIFPIFRNRDNHHVLL